MNNGKSVWKTDRGLDFILSIETNRKQLNQALSKRKIFKIAGWDINKIYWSQTPIFRNLMMCGVIVPMGNDHCELYEINFDQLDELMDKDPRVKLIAKIGWGRIV